MASAGGDLARLIAENAMTALFLMDAAGAATYVNPAAVRMTGWTLAELGGRRLHDVVHHGRPDGATLPSDDSPIGRALCGGGSVREHEDVFVRRDGTCFPVVYSASRIVRGDALVGLVLEVRDVSAERATEEERRRLMREAARAAARGARLQAVSVALGGALTREEVAAVVVDQGVAALGARAGSLAVVADDGATLEVVRGVGYTPEQLARYRRIPVDASFPLCDAVRAGEAIWLRDAAARDAHYPHLAELRRANGGGAMASVPVEAGGRVLGAIGLNFAEEHAFDEAERTFVRTLAAQCAQALERARLYEAERAARAEAERANRAKLDFLAAMSHELRTPLNAIGGYAELLELGVHGPVTPEQARDLARLRVNQRQLLRVIEDLLHFAKLDAGQLAFAIAPVAVAEVFAAAEAIVAPVAASRGLALAIEPGAAGLRVAADPDRLRQVLVNLLTNAVKFSPSGGRVRLAAEPVGPADARVRLLVSDDGPGIPADQLEAIFDPFVQAGPPAARAEGTGLGLTISRELARGMGGELTVASRPGEGATFLVVLPAA